MAVKLNKFGKPTFTLKKVEIRFSLNKDGSGLFKAGDGGKHSSRFMIEKGTENYDKVMEAMDFLINQNPTTTFAHIPYIDCENEEYQKSAEAYAKSLNDKNKDQSIDVEQMKHRDDKYIAVTGKNKRLPRILLKDNTELKPEEITDDIKAKFRFGSVVTASFTLSTYNYRGKDMILCFLNAVKEVYPFTAEQELDDEMLDDPIKEVNLEDSNDDELDSILND